MTQTALLPNQRLETSIARDGYVFVQADEMHQALQQAGSLSDWDQFVRAWDALELDTYMADGGRYRRRRHAVFSAVRGGGIAREPHQPHYQSLDYNPLHGGIARWFEPVTDEIAGGATLRTILTFCHRLFSHLAPDSPAWKVEVHQFRIEARPGVVGRPTPEGMHRDGVDYVLVLLVSRKNIASGTTAIHAPGGRELGRFTLTAPFDAALVDDSRVSHGVTPVEAIDPSLPAYRDVLVVTFKRQNSL